MGTGKLVILSGPSGVGKDSVIDAWREVNPRVTRVIAYTTRGQRPQERDGLDYNFVTREEFLKKAESGDFLEYKEVYGNFYATPLTDLETLLAQGRVAVLKIDVQGALSVMELRKDALSVFLLPPSEEELVQRIKGRGTESGAILEKRIENAQLEIASSDKYQHRVINANIKDAVGALEMIVNG